MRRTGTPWGGFAQGAGQLAGSLAPGGSLQKPVPGPSVMGKMGQWVPPNHPDAMHDPMQTPPPQPLQAMPPAPMPASGDAGTLGNLYAQMQQGTPPPPQAGDWRNAIAGGGIGADPNLMRSGPMPISGNFADVAQQAGDVFRPQPMPDTGGEQPQMAWGQEQPPDRVMGRQGFMPQRGRLGALAGRRFQV